MKSKKFRFSDIARKMSEEQKNSPESPKRPFDDIPPLPRSGTQEYANFPESDDRRKNAFRENAALPGGKKEERANQSKNSSPSFRISKPGIEQELEFDFFRYLGIILQRKKTVAVITLLMTAICLFQYMSSERLYTVHARLLFKPEDKELINIGDETFHNSGNRETAFNTHLELLKSKTVLTLVADNLGNQVRPYQIENALTIAQGQTNRERNDIIELSYKNSKPELARDVLNELCKTYIDYRLEVNSQEVTKLLRKLEEQIEKFQAELDKKEGDLRQFKEENRMAQLSDETNNTVSRLSDMELELQKTQLSLIEGSQKYAALTSQMGQQSQDIVQSITYTDPIRDKLGQLELEYNTLSAENSPEHFKVKMVRQQIEKLKAALVDSLTREAASKTLVSNPIRQSLLQDMVNWNVDRSSLEAKRQALGKVIEKLNGDLLKLPSVEQRYAFLQRETESLLQTLKLLKSKYEDAQIQRDAQETDIKILEMADLPSSAVPSVKFITVIMGILIGLIFGIAVAFLLEYLDQSVKDPIQIEKDLDMPLLGIVPVIETNKALIQQFTDLEKKILEPFRSLRANLKHLAMMHNSKVFMICSAIKGEGKTTLAANLAITFAVDGKKTILVDADLRRSQMHSLFAIPKELGLTDYLLGTKTIDDVLKTTVLDNLSLITSGERPHNPAELVGTYRFDLLVKELRDRADIVIFDSPALLPVSDALTMAPKMDGSIMVFRTSWTPLKAAKQAKHQIARMGCTIFGGIFNGVSLHRSYYPYYYGYYGYYSYSKYTYDDDKKKGSAIRELGLRLEEGFRKSVQAIRYNSPKYIAASRSFARRLTRSRVFWILLLLACGLTAADLLLLNRTSHALTPKGGIEYLGIAGTSNNVPVVTPSAAADCTAAVPATMPQAAPAKTEATVTPDAGSRLWLGALGASDIDGYMNLYDSVDFHFPGGTISQWRERARAYFAVNRGATYRLDSVWQASTSPSLVETRLLVTMMSRSDTSRIVKTLSWKSGARGWKIINDKTGRAP